MASFSAFGGDLPSISFIVLHSLEGSVLWSSVSTNCLHVFLRCSFVVLVISSFICCRAGEVVSCYHLFQYFRWNWFRINTVSSRVYMSRCCFQNDGTQDLFSFWQFDGSRLLLNLSSSSVLYRSQFAFFKLKLVRWGMGLTTSLAFRTVVKFWMLGVLELEESFNSCITTSLTLCRFKNSPNCVSLLPMPFALNCKMVNEFSLTDCVGIGGGCSFGRVCGVLQELKTQSLIRLYFAAF